jgi:hypothetical protein
MATAVTKLIADVKPGEKVSYLERGADLVEWGTVSSRSEVFVFVKFDENVARHGWEGATAKACRPEDLRYYVNS